MAARLLWGLAWTGLLASQVPFVLADEAAPADPAADPAAADAAEEHDPTKELLSRLTIGMVAEVIDERTVALRDHSSNKVLVRLGNVERPPQYALSDADYEKQLEAGKAALTELIAKQMVWFKTAPAKEGAPADEPLLADLWTIDGRHINGALKRKGHVVEAKHYEEELARDILTAEAEESKKQQYEELKEALKESEKEKARAAKEANKKIAEEQGVEPLGLAGWAGLATLFLTILGAVTNFGQGFKKKHNPNRKKNFFERCWSRLKTA